MIIWTTGGKILAAGETIDHFCLLHNPLPFPALLIPSISSFLWALTKFSIRSSINQEDPKFHRVLGIVADSIIFHNDIGSYDKERRSFETGQASSMINAVDVIMKLEQLQQKEGKALAYAWQLFMENELLRELDDLKTRDDLSVADWGFLDACLLMTSGNLITSLFIARYGGEGARIA